jgi:hypothetical protein
MVNAPLLLIFLFSWLIGGEHPVARTGTMPAERSSDATTGLNSNALYAEIGLQGHLAEPVFAAGIRSAERHGQRSRILAIADMTQPSTAKRLYVIDLDSKVLLLRTYVAHGQGSGDLNCTSFSNREGSHQTSKGLYRVGTEIVSPKHGPALLLHGLDKGLNDQALAREVIIHGADYVSPAFIAQHGRLGRSWGCPAVERELMPRLIDLLADGGLLYVHGR